MTVHSDILKELLIAGYEGAHLHAAFERFCATLARHGLVAQPANTAAGPAMPANVVRKVANSPAPARLTAVVTPPPENAKTLARKALAQSMLSPATIALGSHLIERFNLDTGRCDPGSTSLAGDLGISVRQVRRSVKSLVEHGLFSKTRHGGRAFANGYQPNWPLITERAAEGDIAAKRPMLSGQAANVVTQNHLSKPDSDSVIGATARKRAAAAPDRRQGHLHLPIAGGREAAEEAVRSRLTRELNAHLIPLGKAHHAEGVMRSMDVDWGPCITAEIRNSGSGLALLLNAILSVDPSKMAG